MSTLTMSTIKQQVLNHPRIVNRLPPHFQTVELVPIIIPVLYDDLRVKELIKLALDRVTGRIFANLDLNSNSLTLGFENPHDLSFFLLILPNDWQRK